MKASDGKLIVRPVVLIAFICMLNGCAVMKEEECTQANWRDVGKADAMAGLEKQLDKYQKACSAFGVSPSAEEYRLGYAQGVEEHCTYQTGYELGRHGGKLEKACEVEVEYAKGYVKGVDEYVEKTSRDKIERLTRPRAASATTPSSY